jgi:hypothetical protein
MAKIAGKRATPYWTVFLAMVSILVFGCLLDGPDNGLTDGTSNNEDSAPADGIQWEEKIIWEGSIDQPFADDCVLVVMDKNVGGVNKRHDISFFGDIEIESIVDLTSVNPNSELINWELFHQILKLNLPVHSKENVINVIRHLEKIDGIQCASPNYYMQLID